MNKVYIIAGGTLVHVSPHFSLAAPAYGKVGTKIKSNLDSIVSEKGDKGFEFILMPTKMALYECRNHFDPEMYDQILADAKIKSLETYYDVKKFIKHILKDDSTKGIILPSAICDYEPRIIKKIDENKMSLRGVVSYDFGKKAKRLKTKDGNLSLEIQPTDKIVSGIRRKRKDIFLVSFKATAGESVDHSYNIGLKSMKDNKSNLVYINDVQKKVNMIMTPEEFVYTNKSRDELMMTLCELIYDRIDLTYHKTEVKGRSKADVYDLMKRGSIPKNFVDILKHAIGEGAYKPFEVFDKKANGKMPKYKSITVGHFGCKVTGESFSRISSARGSDHNLVLEKGVIKIHGEEGNKIIVSGGKPSVGEHTQKMIYDDLGDKVDSIIHFHCPLKKGVTSISIRPQKPFQCGTDECALNTSNGMEKIIDGVYAVHLEGHGPNIAFSKDIDSSVIKGVIEEYWDLSKKEDGLDQVV